MTTVLARDSAGPHLYGGVSGVLDNTMFSYTIPANAYGTLKPNLSMRLWCDIKNGTGANKTCKLKVLRDSFTVYESSLMPVSSTNTWRSLRFWIDFTILDDSQAGAGHGQLMANVRAALGDSTAPTTGVSRISNAFDAGQPQIGQSAIDTGINWTQSHSISAILTLPALDNNLLADLNYGILIEE